MLRKAHGLTQADTANAAGMSRRFLGAVERGESAASLDTIERLARVIRVPAALFFEDASPETEGTEPAARLGVVARSLATGAALHHVQRAERVLRAYFKDVVGEGGKEEGQVGAGRRKKRRVGRPRMGQKERKARRK